MKRVPPELREILLEVAENKLKMVQSLHKLLDYLHETPDIRTDETVNRICKLLPQDSSSEPELRESDVSITVVPVEVMAKLKHTREAKQIDGIEELLFFPDEWIVEYCGQSMQMTKTEYALLETLAVNPRHIKSRDDLIRCIDPTFTREFDERTIDSHIKRIRQKFKKLNPKFPYIHTVYGGGYCFIRH